MRTHHQSTEIFLLLGLVPSGEGSEAAKGVGFFGWESIIIVFSDGGVQVGRDVLAGIVPGDISSITRRWAIDLGLAHQ